jgi:hypothetical protein
VSRAYINVSNALLQGDREGGRKRSCFYNERFLLLSFRFALNSCSRGPADCRPTVSGNNRKKESVTKMSPEHSRIMQRHIDDLKAKGIVEDSEAFRFNTPVFIVPKAAWREAKDKSDYKLNRPVCDLRLLNSYILPLAIYTPYCRYNPRS